MLARLREWRIDRMTDRVARRPHGRKARAVYGAEDAHSFVWEPVLEALALGPDDTLLDVGCGGGVFLRRALETGCAGVGLDHSREMVKLAREISRARVVEAGADDLPFADGEFTAISCLVAFFFFTDPVRVLRELRRVLDPERGRVVVVTTPPEAKGTPAAPYPLATRGRFYEDAELERLPLDAGFASSSVTRTDVGAQLLVARP
jgi:ubiquinone/menaquinone biosynthesis C-methylase UbiE